MDLAKPCSHLLLVKNLSRDLNHVYFYKGHSVRKNAIDFKETALCARYWKVMAFKRPVLFIKKKYWTIPHQNGNIQCLFHAWKYLYIFPVLAWVTDRALVILVYCRTSGQMGSWTPRAYVSVCVCIPGHCQLWHGRLRRGPGNSALPRYGCHSSMTGKCLTGRLTAVHVRAVREIGG